MTAPLGLTALLGAAVSLASVAPVATAATLRAIVQIKGPTVHLSDLFAGLEGGQDCALGDAPAPGTRLVIYQPQIEAISSQFGVNWNPVGTDQTVTLDRAGRTVERATVVSMLQGALAKQYGTTRIVVTLASYQDEAVDLNAKLKIGELSTDDADGEFQAVLLASLDGNETLRVPLSGRIERLLTVPVPTRPIAAGQVISDQDLSMIDVAADRVRADVLEHGEQGIGLVPVRLLPVGVPILRSDLHRPDIVFRGGPVMMRLAINGIEVEAQGQSLESGTLADRVRVLNPISRAVLLATVSGQNEVRIDPSSMPLVQTRSGGTGRSDFGTYEGSAYAGYAGAVTTERGEP